MSRFLAALALVLFAPVLGGCGDDCEDFCEEARSCANADNDLAGADCEAECQRAEDLADAAECSDEFYDFIDCALDTDVCNGAKECQAEALVYAFCGLLYCTSNPGAPECKGSFCTTSTSSSGMTSCEVERKCEGEPTLSLTCNETECTCGRDQATVKTVPKDAAFCSASTAGDAAEAACGW